MNKLAKWILVTIAVTAVCTATAEAAKWKFTSTDMGWSSSDHPEWGVYNGNGWLTVWPTINCDPQDPPLVENEYVLGGDEYEGDIPKGKGYNDFMAYFKWDFGCENEDWYKWYVCEDGELEPMPLPEWIDGNVATPITLPALGDPTGTDPNIYVLVNLRVAYENPAPPLQESYVFNDGVCEQLPGYQAGTTPFDYKGRIPCHPFETDNLFTGTLYMHAQIDVIGEDGDGIRPPTLSQWGLIIMALLLVTVGAIMIRKRRQLTA